MGQGGKMLAIAMVLGLITAVLVYLYVGRMTQVQPAQHKPQLAEVVVARQELPPRTVITPDMLKLERVPVELIHKDAAISLDQVNGRIVKSPIMAGEQVLTTRLVPAGQKPSMAFAIPPGRRAVTVAVNEVVGVAGFVQAGDRVDVLSNLEDSEGNNVSVIVLQNVPVLAIDQIMESELDAKPKVVTTVTLAVTLREAQRLALAESQGSLRLALRPAGALAKEMIPPVSETQLLPPPKPTPKPAPAPPTQPRPVRPPVVVKPVEPKNKVQVVEVIRGTQREIVTIE